MRRSPPKINKTAAQAAQMARKSLEMEPLRPQTALRQ
jgi:hypothetical protein